jgi:hypothetical protein
VGIRFADHVTHSLRKKLTLTSPTNSGRSVAIVRSQTKTTESYQATYCSASYRKRSAMSGNQVHYFCSLGRLVMSVAMVRNDTTVSTGPGNRSGRLEEVHIPGK